MSTDNHDPDTHVRETTDGATTHSEYDRERPSGTRREPHPGKTFEDYETGDVVPVPEYFGTVTWIFEGTRWSR